MSIAGKKALVTGGTRGIGAAIAQALLEEGCTVTVTGRSAREGWWSGEANCHMQVCDFSDGAATDVFCEQVAGTGYDLLVNNCGSFYASDIAELDLAQWESLMQVNLSTPMRLIRAVAAHMRGNGWGRIVNIGSIAASVTRSNMAAYASSKAGLAGLTRAAALDLAPAGILVNCVCPAYTETDMLAALDASAREALLAKVPLGKFARPEDVAAATLFLLSNQNQFITGQQLILDGGVTIQ